MSDDDKQALPATRPQNVIESQIIEEVVEAEFDVAQSVITRHLEALQPNQRESELELFLQSFWNHLEGVRLIREEGNFDLAGGFQESAATGFQQLGIKELESVSRCLSAYSNAITEVRRLNITRSMELFAATEKYLRDAGRYGGKFQLLIDHMKPEGLFLGVLPTLMAGDIASAKVLATQASEASRKIAEKYYEKGTPLHFTFLGLAQFYGAFFSYFRAQMDLSNLELDRLASEDISASAKEAERLLAQADLANAQIQSIHHISKALVELSEVTKGVATRMHLCFKAAFKPDLQGFLDLRAMTRRAIDNASNAGPQALPLVRSCDGLLVRIQNLERLARPRKVDFGIYSGLISAALFVPLFFVASWTRSKYNLGLDGITFFLTIVGLALIGGFGFGAVRFKHFLFSRPQRDEVSAQPDASADRP